MNRAVGGMHNADRKAVAASVALHALIGAWALSGLAPVKIMPQQMIKVTVLAAPAAAVMKQTSGKLPQEAPQPDRRMESVRPPVPRRESARAAVKPATAHMTALPPRETQTVAALSPSAGHTPAAQASAQMATTAPLFDAAYLNNPAPEYPGQARRRGMEGSVMLGVTVREDGTAKSVTITRSSGFAMLDESAKYAVSRWKFVPARQDGETVEARVMVPIDFKLE